MNSSKQSRYGFKSIVVLMVGLTLASVRLAEAQRGRADGCIPRAFETTGSRGLVILIAGLTTRKHKTIFLLCDYFAIMGK